MQHPDRRATLSTKKTLVSLLERYTRDRHLVNRLSAEVDQHYAEPHRHYHNQHHLNHLLANLTPCKHEAEDWDVLLFATFYHDIVYDVGRTDNEERSARAAEYAMGELNIPSERIQRCADHILATRHHTFRPDRDTCLFLDADLAILGAAADEYLRYSRQIREEYSIFPDEDYHKGRLKVLQHLLAQEFIYQTERFRTQYEKQARINLKGEIKRLSNREGF